MLPKFVKVFPHEYKRVLGVARRKQVAAPQVVAAGDRVSRRRRYMGKVTGFLEYTRELPQRRPVAERINDWFEIYQPISRGEGPHAGRALHGLRRAVLPHRLSAEQHHSRLERPGVSRTAGSEAIRVLHATNNFPEFTGRICPGAVRSRVRARHQ